MGCTSVESQASIVFRKITKAFEQNEKGQRLTCEERDLVANSCFFSSVADRHFIGVITTTKRRVTRRMTGRIHVREGV